MWAINVKVDNINFKVQKLEDNNAEMEEIISKNIIESPEPKISATQNHISP